MKCFYINLDSQTERRDAVEKNFAENRADGWTLTRFPAIDVNYVSDNGVKGSLRPPEKACLLSHMHILGGNLDDKETIFLLEDDVVFGRQTCNVVQNLVKHLEGQDWDILFTDVCVPTVGAMYDLFKLRQQIMLDGNLQLLNLAELPFAGTTAYLVNGKSKRKIFDLLNSLEELNTPYDLFLRTSVRQSKVNGFVTFPFVTTLSDLSEASAIQELQAPATDMIWNLFRKLVWLESDFSQLRPHFDLIGKNVTDDASAAFGTLVSLMSSDMYKTK